MEQTTQTPLKCVGLLCRTKPRDERSPRASQPRPCPYDREINDGLLFCRCCDDCRTECQDDI